MRKATLYLMMVSLAACSQSTMEKRSSALKAAVARSGECKDPAANSSFLACIGSKVIEEDGKASIDPTLDVERIKYMVSVQYMADVGRMSQQEADRLIDVNNANVRLQQIAIDNQADGARSQATRSDLGTALMGMGMAAQGFSNGYNAGVRSIPVTPYRSPTTCRTQPSGNGFVTSCQ
ncbi:hypothetical protein [Asaia sp. HN010]|uniref:hypothetical protein n=1 Tax=Asaia sp. HN010 TaxID=3081233 RepID=UPI00301974CD